MVHIHKSDGSIKVFNLYIRCCLLLRLFLLRLEHAIVAALSSYLQEWFPHRFLFIFLLLTFFIPTAASAALRLVEPLLSFNEEERPVIAARVLLDWLLHDLLSLLLLYYLDFLQLPFFEDGL